MMIPLIYMKTKKDTNFDFLVFQKIRKDSGPKLLRKFKEMNSNPEENKNNMDRELYLTKYSSQFEDSTG